MCIRDRTVGGPAAHSSGRPDLYVEANEKEGKWENMIESMIQLDNIEVKFGSFVALHAINIDIHEGEFFTFLLSLIHIL